MSVFDSLQPEQDRRDDLPERTMADVLALPEDLRTSMDYLIEQGESELAEVAAHMTAAAAPYAAPDGSVTLPGVSLVARAGA